MDEELGIAGVLRKQTSVGIKTLVLGIIIIRRVVFVKALELIAMRRGLEVIYQWH